MTKRKTSTSAKTGAKRQSAAKGKPSVKKTAPASDTGPTSAAQSANTATTAETGTTAAPAHTETAAAPAAVVETTAPSAATATRSAGLSRWAVPGAIAATLAGAGLWYAVSGPETGTTGTDVTEQAASTTPAGEHMALQSPAQPAKQADTATENDSTRLSAAEHAGQPAPGAAAGTGAQPRKSDDAAAPDQRVAASSKATGPASSTPSATTGNVAVAAQNQDQWGRVMNQAMNPLTYFQMMAAMTQGAMNAANGSAQPVKKPEVK